MQTIIPEAHCVGASQIIHRLNVWVGFSETEKIRTCSSRIAHLPSIFETSKLKKQVLGMMNMLRKALEVTELDTCHIERFMLRRAMDI